jgi:hypothetical protein
MSLSSFNANRLTAAKNQIIAIAAIYMQQAAGCLERKRKWKEHGAMGSGGLKGLVGFRESVASYYGKPVGKKK